MDTLQWPTFQLLLLSFHKHWLDHRCYYLLPVQCCCRLLLLPLKLLPQRPKLLLLLLPLKLSPKNQQLLHSTPAPEQVPRLLQLLPQGLLEWMW